MHLLTSLIIISGFVFVFCLGLVKVIWDLPEMSAHVAPEMLQCRWGGFLRSNRDMRTRLKYMKRGPSELSETDNCNCRSGDEFNPRGGSPEIADS
jgi:hypothetical protein